MENCIANIYWHIITTGHLCTIMNIFKERVLKFTLITMNLVMCYAICITIPYFQNRAFIFFSDYILIHQTVNLVHHISSISDLSLKLYISLFTSNYRRIFTVLQNSLYQYACRNQQNYHSNNDNKLDQSNFS